MEIAEVIRRWQAGFGPQQIASGTGPSRNTVRKYLAAARAMGITKDGPQTDEVQLSLLAAIGQSGPRQVHTPRQDALEPRADQIYQWLTVDRLHLTQLSSSTPDSSRSALTCSGPLSVNAHSFSSCLMAST